MAEKVSEIDTERHQTDVQTDSQTEIRTYKEMDGRTESQMDSLNNNGQLSIGEQKTMNIVAWEKDYNYIISIKTVCNLSIINHSRHS